MTYIEGLNAPRDAQRPPAGRGAVPAEDATNDRQAHGATARAGLGRSVVAQAVLARPEPADDASQARRAAERAAERAALEASSEKGRNDAKDQIDAIASQRGLRPSDISMCLTLGRVDAAIEVAARLSGVPTTAAVRAYQMGDVGKALSQLASVGVDSGTAAWLLRGMGRVLPGEYGMAVEASSAYAKASTLTTRPQPRDITPAASAPSRAGETETDGADDVPESEADDPAPYPRLDMRV